MSDAMGSRKAKPREIVQIVTFLVIVVVPLILIPVFPKFRILQAINENGICLVVFVVFAALISMLITWVIFRRKI